MYCTTSCTPRAHSEFTFTLDILLSENVSYRMIINSDLSQPICFTTVTNALAYLSHKCTMKVCLFVNPFRTLSDKSGVLGIWIVVAMVTIKIAFRVRRQQRKFARRHTSVDHELVLRTLNSKGIILGDSTPTNHTINI